jgi:hypothetical protein
VAAGLQQALPPPLQQSLLEERPGLARLYQSLSLPTLGMAQLLAQRVVPLLPHALPDHVQVRGG